MTVNELIAKLQLVKDKEKEVKCCCTDEEIKGVYEYERVVQIED